MLLVFDAPSQLASLAGLEHGRTIPLSDIMPCGAVERGRIDMLISRVSLTPRLVPPHDFWGTLPSAIVHSVPELIWGMSFRVGTVGFR